ncbi:MAG TPA: helix-hairpin-helix domain-containing protein [Deltaproteobacteria bacterium]|nr:helix-hairpin-helix domain-containing protein [Deltaproteobacteria bacterium]HQJ08075.1 helix-hairpin-helix domain-containing protein [Deltaproteobacteria bacterium]
MKKYAFIAGAILIALLSFGVSSCEKNQGAAGTGTAPQASAPSESPSSPQAEAPSGSQMGAGQAMVDINTASAEELQSVPGIDQTLAQNIVSYREANGPFSSVDDLLKVQGMDQQKLDSIRSYITLGTASGGAAPMGGGAGAEPSGGTGMEESGAGSGSGSSGY